MSDDPRLDEALAYAERAEWRFASTVPEAPHEYVVPGADQAHWTLLRVITEQGWDRRWPGIPGKARASTWRTLTTEEWHYWAGPGALINRKRRGDPADEPPEPA